jgi:phenylacetate-coenzyme A ligase PaaK-like adenylate-forming protein
MAWLLFLVTWLVLFFVLPGVLLKGACLVMYSVFAPWLSGLVSVDVLCCTHAVPSVLAQRQQERLQALLRGAMNNSPFYREHLAGVVPAHTRLQDLPSVGKAQLMARFEDWVTDPDIHWADVQALLTDTSRMAEPYLGRYLVWESSGTTHQPGVFLQDAPSLAVYDALQALRRSDPNPWQRSLDSFWLTERIAFVGATEGHFASVVSMLRLGQLNPCLAQSQRRLSIMQPLEALLDELNAFEPSVIATYPTVAALLAEQARRGALHFSPREIWTGGETLSDAVRHTVQTSLGCTVRNSYGASEFLTLAWECSHGHLHANSDWVILEPVDQQGQPVAPGTPSYTTLLTHLANQVQPLIRYDLGDQLTVHLERCACGSHLPVIEVLGRHDDVLVMRNAHGQQVSLLPLALTTVLEEEAGVFDFQVRQLDARTLTLWLGETLEEGAAQRCQTALKKYAAQQGLPQLKLQVERGHQIPKGRSGKLQRIVALASADPAS